MRFVPERSRRRLAGTCCSWRASRTHPGVDAPGHDEYHARCRDWVDNLGRGCNDHYMDRSAPVMVEQSNRTESADRLQASGFVDLADEAVAQRDLSVGSVLREARELDRIGVRELARRSGVDPSRISRIETSRTAKPDRPVLAQLARGLGRRPEGLYELAGHAVDIFSLSGTNDDLFDRFLKLSAEVAGEDPDAPSDVWMHRFARLSFLLTDPLGELLASEDPDDADSVREIVGSWSSLTSSRRNLVRAFVADQVALSDLDRRGRHASRYDLVMRSEEL